MNGPEFNNPIQRDLTASNTRDSSHVDKKNADKQQKIADLKARVESGQYHVDTQALAKRVEESGVLDNE